MDFAGDKFFFVYTKEKVEHVAQEEVKEKRERGRERERERDGEQKMNMVNVNK